MSFAVKTLAAASLTILAAGTFSAAHAENALLFPYVTTANGAYTFLSLYHDPYAGKATGDEDHFNDEFTMGVFTQPVSATGGCSGKSATYEIPRPGTLMQWEAGGRFNLASDFGDNHNDISGLIGANQHGYMTIQYSDLPHGGMLNPPDAGKVFGDAIIIDTATGMIFSYSALTGDTAQSDFSEQAGTEFASSWFPQVIAGTSWYVLPVGPFAKNSSLMSTSALDVSVNTNSRGKTGMYARNGLYYPVTKKVNVQCPSVLSLSDLVPDAYATMGGWFTLKTTAPAMVWKIQQSGELGFPAASMSAATVVR